MDQKMINNDSAAEINLLYIKSYLYGSGENTSIFANILLYFGKMQKNIICLNENWKVIITGP
jgi:hypothetical protein